ncbi:FG-GAP repeat domain-containing protein [Paenibacillus selenitireducens]|nr:VCBS repeat-containing protein [Paenibacillus selenitireducens]
MSIPRLPEDKENLKSLIMAQLPEGASIIRPTNIKDTSAIRIADLNNDGVSEAVVFYRTPDQAVRIHGMIWESDGTTWKKKLVFDGEGLELDSFDLVDIMHDGKVELVVGYSSGDTEVQKGLIVYSYEDDQLQKVFEKSYTNYVINDLNGDGKFEISILTFKPNQIAELTSIQYNEHVNKFEPLSTLQLEPNVTGYYNVITGMVAENVQGIVLDVGVGAHSAYTDVVIMKNNTLTKVLSSEETYKPYATISSDENKDGIIEIAMLETPYGWEDIALSSIPWFITYHRWDGEHGLKFVFEQYRDLQDRFYFNFPAEWHHKVTISIDSKLEEYLNFINIETGETMAEIRFFSLSAWERNHEGFKLLARTEEKVIGLRSTVDLNAGKGKVEITPVVSMK